MNNLATTTGRSAPPAQQRRPDIAQVMRKALAPYAIVSEQLGVAERAVYGVRDLLVRDRGELRAIKHLPAAPVARWDLHSRAANALDWLPADRIAAADKALTEAITTKPPPSHTRYLAGAMLDGLGIRAGDDTDGYIGALCLELADVTPDNWESYRTPKHIPLAALARTVRRLWTTEGDNYGRPPPISKVLERCTEARRDLCREWDRITAIVSARHDLLLIADATADAMPPDDDDNTIPF